MKKFKIIIEQIHIEKHTMELDGISCMDALDQARILTVTRNKRVPVGTVYSVKKVEEISND
jgi:hypothetical protein